MLDGSCVVNRLWATLRSLAFISEMRASGIATSWQFSRPFWFSSLDRQSSWKNILNSITRGDKNLSGSYNFPTTATTCLLVGSMSLAKWAIPSTSKLSWSADTCQHTPSIFCCPEWFLWAVPRVDLAYVSSALLAFNSLVLIFSCRWLELVTKPQSLSWSFDSVYNWYAPSSVLALVTMSMWEP